MTLTAAQRLVLSLMLAGSLVACTTPQPAGPPQAFSSDGCSLFPNRSRLLQADWCACCVVHDVAYWRGGTAEERAQADEALRACVARASGSLLLGQLMHTGVRVGGLPDWRTRFRWGYGWPQQRAYGPLSPSEKTQAEQLTPEAVATEQAAVCGPQVTP